MKKRIFPALLAACLLITAGSSTVHAQDYTEDTEGAQTSVSFTVENTTPDPDPDPDPVPDPPSTSSWVVSIPATLSLSQSGLTPFNITASRMDIDTGKVVRVKLDTEKSGISSDGVMKLNSSSGGTDQAIFYLYREGAKYSPSTIQNVAMFYHGDTTNQLGSLNFGLFPDTDANSKIQSGTYSGSLYFNIALENY